MHDTKAAGDLVAGDVFADGPGEPEKRVIDTRPSNTGGGTLIVAEDVETGEKTGPIWYGRRYAVAIPAQTPIGAGR